MTDQEFLHAFESGRIPPAEFHHRDHLRLAWVQVRKLGAEQAAGAVAEGIGRFAGAHGQHRLYHETLTRFWVRIVAHCSQPTFEATLELVKTPRPAATAFPTVTQGTYLIDPSSNAGFIAAAKLQAAKVPIYRAADMRTRCT